MRRAAGFVIFRKLQSDVEYLLLQASYGDYHWSPPKGHLDPGESEMEAALRETEEEAGFVKSDLIIYEDSAKQLNYEVKCKPKVVHYWLAKLKNDKSITLSKEHKDGRWFNFEDALKFAQYSDMQDLLKYYQTYISNKGL